MNSNIETEAEIMLDHMLNNNIHRLSYLYCPCPPSNKQYNSLDKIFEYYRSIGIYNLFIQPYYFGQKIIVYLRQNIKDSTITDLYNHIINFQFRTKILNSLRTYHSSVDWDIQREAVVKATIVPCSYFGYNELIHSDYYGLISPGSGLAIKDDNMNLNSLNLQTLVQSTEYNEFSEDLDTPAIEEELKDYYGKNYNNYLNYYNKSLNSLMNDSIPQEMIEFVKSICSHRDYKLPKSIYENWEYKVSKDGVFKFPYNCNESISGAIIKGVTITIDNNNNDHNISNILTQMNRWNMTNLYCQGVIIKPNYELKNTKISEVHCPGFIYLRKEANDLITPIDYDYNIDFYRKQYEISLYYITQIYKNSLSFNTSALSQTSYNEMLEILQSWITCHKDMEEMKLPKYY